MTSSLPVAVVVAKAPYSVRKNTTNFSDVPLPPEIFFCWNDPKSRVPFAFQLDFLEPFENGKQPEPWMFPLTPTHLNKGECIFFMIGHLHDDFFFTTKSRIHFVSSFIVKFDNPSEFWIRKSPNLHKKAKLWRILVIDGKMTPSCKWPIVQCTTQDDVNLLS